MREFNYDTLKKIAKTKKGKTYIAKVEKYYQERYVGKPILALSYSEYKRYWIDGDRNSYETAYFERRNRLFLLQILAIAKDKYLSLLEDVLASICDEYTWVVPAHAKHPIDLFAAETGGYLSETAYIFKDKLSEDIKQRIYNSVANKIVKAYEETPKFIWENYKNNWLAVCACGIGLSYLYLFPERFDKVKARLLGTFQAFIEKGFDEEGYCSEGVDYWVYGFGFFCSFFGAYEYFCKERPDFIDCPKVKRTLNYLKNARMQQNVYLPFADGGRQITVFNAHTLAPIKGLYPYDFTYPQTELVFSQSKAVGFTFLYNLSSYKKPKLAEKEESCYFQGAQVFIRKRKNYAFAVKCGHNNEYHNHDDVGAFQIVKDGQRYICDVGAGLYTKTYFGIGRYDIFNCSSLSHSVPIIDGSLQAFNNEKYCGKVLCVDKNSITMDIAKAYENGPSSVVVEYVTREDGVDISYACTGIRERIDFHFVSDLKPKIKNGYVYIADMKISCDKKLEPKIAKVNYISHYNEKIVAYTIDYPVQSKNAVNVSFSLVFEKKSF